jgi:hypothetical protein
MMKGKSSAVYLQQKIEFELATQDSRFLASLDHYDISKWKNGRQQYPGKRKLFGQHLCMNSQRAPSKNTKNQCREY